MPPPRTCGVDRSPNAATPSVDAPGFKVGEQPPPDLKPVLASWCSTTRIQTRRRLLRRYQMRPTPLLCREATGADAVRDPGRVDTTASNHRDQLEAVLQRQTARIPRSAGFCAGQSWHSPDAARAPVASHFRTRPTALRNLRRVHAAFPRRSRAAARSAISSPPDRPPSTRGSAGLQEESSRATRPVWTAPRSCAMIAFTRREVLRER